MKLRLIFLVLSLLVFLSAATGSYLYYASLKRAAFAEAEHNAKTRIEIIQKNLSSYLSENVKPVRALAGMRQIVKFLKSRARATPARSKAANRQQVEVLLDHFNHALNANVCYLMDKNGITLVSSNHAAADSFVGKNFSFRPYFQTAVKGLPASYLALGTTSGKRGIYCSYPVIAEPETAPLGVVVIKASLEQIEKKLGQSRDEVVVVTDPHGLIFIANRKSWRFKLLWRISPSAQRQLAASRQFGSGPWAWVGLKPDGRRYAVDENGRRYLVNHREIDGFPGWQVIHLRSLKAIYKVVFDPLVRVTVPTVVTLCILVGLAVFFLYRHAIAEIVQRKQAEAALKQAQEKLSLYTRDLERQVKKRTAELQRLSGSILADQERERAAIARGLHDELGQVLTALRLEAVWLTERLRPLDAKAAERAAMMTSLIDDTIDEVRSIALRLRPGILDDLGLVEALEWYAADFERRTGIASTCNVEGEIPELDDTLATAAYRISQEALTNVARHSEADQVKISLFVEAGWLRMQISDNGRGFNAGAAGGNGGLGIAGMRERATLIGGFFAIVSKPGQGTRISFRAKIEEGEIL